LTKGLHDPLWYVASVEGIAASIVAMSDTGGHGADIGEEFSVCRECDGGGDTLANMVSNYC